ncbi:hypothetical protein IQ252_18385 [Tychonema sp. LEGE 07203]|nr:hypothetical protein [Tychonema sp. LEGE 07203]
MSVVSCQLVGAVPRVPALLRQKPIEMSQTTLYPWRHHSAVSRAARSDRPNPQSAPAIPHNAEVRYNQKSIGLALSLREC